MDPKPGHATSGTSSTVIKPSCWSPLAASWLAGSAGGQPPASWAAMRLAVSAGMAKPTPMLPDRWPM